MLRQLKTRAAAAFRAARLRMQQPSEAPVETVAAGGPASPAAAEGEARFSGERAFALLEAQCGFGPRVPGSEGHARTREWIVEHLGRWTDEVAVQRWTQKVARGAGAGRAYPMANLFGIIRGRDELDVPAEELRPDLMLAAHWDTRPLADADPDPANRALPVPGASDGASGVAVLLEAARVLHASRPARTVLLAFLDGEDLGEYYYGSRLFGRMAARAGFARWRARRGVVVDMVGGRGVRCTTEIHSLRQAAPVWNEVRAAAEALGLGERFSGPARYVTDDHVFLSRAGIPSIVLIDYRYPFWHTVADTPDKCEPESLRIVGDVVVRLAAGGAAAPPP